MSSSQAAKSDKTEL